MTILAAIFSAPPWLIGVLFVCLVGAVLTARWGIKLWRDRDDGHLWWDRRGGHLTWDDEWQREPVTDQDAAELVATWHDEPASVMVWNMDDKAYEQIDYMRPVASLPGPADQRRPDTAQTAPARRAGELHERLAGRDVWDQWWQDLDGLHRECLLVTRVCEREAAAWAELVAETRELCGLAA